MVTEWHLFVLFDPHLRISAKPPKKTEGRGLPSEDGAQSRREGFCFGHFGRVQACGHALTNVCRVSWNEHNAKRFGYRSMMIQLMRFG